MCDMIMQNLVFLMMCILWRCVRVYFIKAQHSLVAYNNMKRKISM
jgi:hypothetical protein